MKGVKMKFIHLSDLHLGKRVNEFSMFEDQEYILTKIINIIDEETPEGVIIAGDVYDKSVPAVDAVQLFDDFLVKLSNRALKVFIISGNHDSAERMAFGSRVMNKSGIYISEVYNGKISPISLEDSYGIIDIFMLPFIKPVHVRRFEKEKIETDVIKIETYTDAMKSAIDTMTINPANRNLLIAHQFVTGAVSCDSEEISVGGSDNVDAAVFEPFDYVALGHIHGPQKAGRETIRYCGTPLKYSFSEAKHKKSVTVVELMEKGSITVRTVPLLPKRDMREIKGSYMEVTARDYYKDTQVTDYMHITLTDEEDVPEAMGKLRVIYPNLMKLDYDNARTRKNNEISEVQNIERKTPQELFEEFYLKQNNQEMSQVQREFVVDLIEKIWEE